MYLKTFGTVTLEYTSYRINGTIELCRALKVDFLEEFGKSYDMGIHESTLGIKYLVIHTPVNSPIEETKLAQMERFINGWLRALNYHKKKLREFAENY